MHVSNLNLDDGKVSVDGSITSIEYKTQSGDLKSRGKNIIRLCESPPCYIKGSDNILRKLKNTLGVKVGETSKDGLFTLELAACLGVCGNAPVMMINDEVYGDLTEEKIDEILEKIRGGK